MLKFESSKLELTFFINKNISRRIHFKNGGNNCSLGEKSILFDISKEERFHCFTVAVRQYVHAIYSIPESISLSCT